MVGIGGFAEVYLRELLHNPRWKQLQIVGAVDPYAERSRFSRELSDRKVPIYQTVEEFYEKQKAELAIIVTPIYLHARQAEYCMEHGSIWEKILKY